MQKHTKLYLDFFGYTKQDTEYMPCETCENQAVDVNHIDARGMGGSDEKDVIENLMAMCRRCHIIYGDQKQYKDMLKKVHYAFIRRYKPNYEINEIVNKN